MDDQVTISLADLEINDKGIILEVNARGEIRRRLLDMGLVKGVKFKVIRVAPLGDPVEIFIKGFFLSLRLEEARSIVVSKTGCKGDRKQGGYGFGKRNGCQKRHGFWHFLKGIGTHDKARS